MSLFNRITNFATKVVANFNPSRGDAEAAIRSFAMVAAADGVLKPEEASSVVAYIDSLDWISSYGDHDACEELFMEVTTKICDASTPALARMMIKGEASKLQKLVRKGSENARTIYELCVELATENGKIGEDENKVLKVLKTNLGAF